jgi:hypothetical protein
MSFRGRPKSSCLSNEELIGVQQKQERLEAQEKAKKERAERRKVKNKGYMEDRKENLTLVRKVLWSYSSNAII